MKSPNELFQSHHYKILPSDNVRASPIVKKRSTSTSNSLAPKLSVDTVAESTKSPCSQKPLQTLNSPQTSVAISKEYNPPLCSASNSDESSEASGRSKIISLSIDMMKRITRVSSEDRLIGESKEETRKVKMVRSKSFYGVDTSSPGSKTRPMEAWLRQRSLDTESEDDQVCRRCQHQAKDQNTFAVQKRRNAKAEILDQSTNNDIFSSLGLSTKKEIPTYTVQNSQLNNNCPNNTPTFPNEDFKNSIVNMVSVKTQMEMSNNDTNTREPSDSDTKANDKIHNTHFFNKKSSNFLVDKENFSKTQGSKASEEISPIPGNSLAKRGSESHHFRKPEHELKYTTSQITNALDSIPVAQRRESLISVYKAGRKPKTQQDQETKPKYTGYKPKNGICFVSFKTMFTKPMLVHSSSEEREDQGFSDLDVIDPTTEEDRKSDQRKLEKQTPSKGYRVDDNSLWVSSSNGQFSNQDRKIIDKTRKELQEKISSVQNPNLGYTSSEKKIQLNIFLQDKVNKYKSSLDTSTSTEDEGSVSWEEREVTNHKNSSTENPSKSCESVTYKELSEVHETDKGKDVSCLQLPNSERNQEKLVYYSYGEAKYIEPVKPLYESSPSNSKLLETPPNLLQAIINDNNQKAVKRRHKLKRNK